MGDLFNPKYGAPVCIGPFFVANLDTALTNTDLVTGVAGVTLVGMPCAGTVLGVSIDGNAAPSAGTVIASVHSSGTELTNGPTATIDSATNTLHSFGLVSAARTHTFAKGAKLGVSATTTTTLAATTVDYTAYIWVRFDPDGAAGA